MFHRNNKGAAEQPRKLTRRDIVRALVLMLIFLLITTFILVYRFLPSDVANLKLGDVAPRDILATRQIVYTSDIETGTQRERARSAIVTIYTQPDPKVARQQMNRLRYDAERILSVVNREFDYSKMKDHLL